jgi:hypothetical protein
VVGDPREDGGEIGLRIDAVEFCCFDQRIHRGGAPAAGIGPGAKR